ncbi:MAG: CoA pyrophosphatase [Dehalococcoidia bacterium]|nr:CoA pyrophosphatase [Dehalococcoidia bacterium]
MKEKLRQALALRLKTSLSGRGLTEAAVLIPIFCKDGEHHILFIKRSDQVQHHKGQISFPGGARSEADAGLLETALRESWEEIGLEVKDVEVLGELDDIPTTTSSFNVSPFVAFIPYPYQFTLSPYEIDEIFSVPVSGLLYEAKRGEERYTFDDEVFVGYSYEYEGRVIWGATAQIVRQLLEVWQSVSGAQR